MKTIFNPRRGVTKKIYNIEQQIKTSKNKIYNRPYLTLATKINTYIKKEEFHENKMEYFICT